MRKSKYTNFKIFAVTPLSDCNKDILKVLRKNEVYYLYNDYVIEKVPQMPEKLTYKKSYPNNLYDAFGLHINICAIAGKNGSGKSTLTELILMAINNIGCHFKIKSDLQVVKGLHVALYIQATTCYKVTINGKDLTIEYFDRNGILREGDGTTQGVQRLKGLFYTICMNYSHYAYNYRDYTSKIQSDWLSPLFHKNDAYQTPLVINPWRDNGDVIIARENALVQSRLIANLLRPAGQSQYDFRNIAENLQAYALKLELDRAKVFDSVLYRRLARETETSSDKMMYISYGMLTNINKGEILKRINKDYNFKYEQYLKQSDDIADLAMDYLVRKLISIAVKYVEYSDYFIIHEDKFNYKSIGKYIKKITRDRTHIGFKFRQTLNFLRHRHIDLDPKNLTLNVLSKRIQGIINDKVNYRDQIIELIPPPIFAIDILLQPIRGVSKDLTVKLLSSGEKQMIYSLSSILYHLFNLDSVPAKSTTKISYRTVNIILEEIELYFHPEMQRQYVKFLRDSILHLGLSKIRDINICFVTHSPFILSDIPDSNILFLQLKDGQAVQVNRFRKTFAANIHDLLSDVFFMVDGVSGAFAIGEIQKTIVFLNNHATRKEILEKLQKQPNDTKLLDELELIEFELSDENPAEDHLLLIQNVGEPVIKTKLEEMYNEVFPNVNRRKKIQAEIERLQKLLNED